MTTAATPQIFGQSQPKNTNSESLLYTVPQNQQSQTTIFVCNQGSQLENFRIAIVQSGNNLSSANYIAYDTQLIGNGIYSIGGIGLNSGDSIWVKSALGNLSFTATGIEFS